MLYRSFEFEVIIKMILKNRPNNVNYNLYIQCIYTINLLIFIYNFFIHFQIFKLIICFTLILGVHNVHQKENYSPTLSSPLLWRPSSHAVAQQVVFHTINFTIQSPCSEFIEILSFKFKNESSNNDNQSIKQYQIWCQNLYNQLIIGQIRENCPLVDKIRIQMPDMRGNNISKRSLPENIVSFKWISVVTALGFFTKELFSKFDTEARLNELELNNAQRMQFFEWSQQTSNEIHHEIFRQMLLLSQDVDKLSYRLSEQNLLNVASSTLYMSISSKLYQVDSYFKNFFESLRKNKISKDFEYLFPNLTLCNSNEKCPREYWTGYGCETLVSNEIDGNIVNMVLKLSTVVVHSIYRIVEVDPFVIRKSQDETSTCFYEYNGRQLFLYNSNTDCIKDIVNHKLKNPSAIMFAYDFENSNIMKTRCSNWPDFLDEYWRQSYCKKTKDLFAEEIVQIKTDNNFIYIYCFAYNLTIFNDEYKNRSFICDNIIYQLNRNTSFMIGNTSFIVQHKHQHVWSYLVPIKYGTIDSSNETIVGKYLREHGQQLIRKHHAHSVLLGQRFEKLKNLLEYENKLFNETKNDHFKLISFLHARVVPMVLLFLLLITWLIMLIACFYCNCCCCSCSSFLCCCKRRHRSKRNQRK